MARSLNKVMLIGNLGADPEIKYTPGGTAVANLNLATTESRKNRDNEWEETTEWHRVVMFGRLAETCKDYLKKGGKVFIEGRLQTRSWEDQSGQKKYMTEVVGSNMLMLDGRSQDQGSGRQIQGSGSSQQQRGKGRTAGRNQDIPEPPGNYPQGDDDLPF